MNSPQQQFQAFLELQRAEYRRTLPDKLAHVQALWLAAETGTGPADLAGLERLAHTLAGTAGTLGLREVGLAARALEVLLADTGQGSAVLTSGQRAAISRAVAALRDSPHA